MKFHKCIFGLFFSGFAWCQSIGYNEGLEIIKVAESCLIMPKASPDGLYEVRVYVKGQDVLLEYTHECGGKLLYRFDVDKKFKRLSVGWRKSKGGFRLLIGRDVYAFVVAVAEGKVS